MQSRVAVTIQPSCVRFPLHLCSTQKGTIRGTLYVSLQGEGSRERACASNPHGLESRFGVGAGGAAYLGIVNLEAQWPLTVHNFIPSSLKITRVAIKVPIGLTTRDMDICKNGQLLYCIFSRAAR